MVIAVSCGNVFVGVMVVIRESDGIVEIVC